MPRFETLSAILPAASRDDRELTFIDGVDEQRTITFGTLRHRALALLGALQRRGLGRGDTMVLFVGDNERFVEMFWACVLGGIVPVPLAAAGADEHVVKLLRVFAQLERASVYIDRAGLERLDAHAAAHDLSRDAARLREAALLAGSFDASGAAGEATDPDPDDLAFIQYSSGSTGSPKGVMLTHRNLAVNIAAMIDAANLTDRDSSLSWMPLSHDMGLIGFHLKMLACGASHAIMRTDLFARRPLLWLELASRRRVTLLSSPNFGYQHYLRQYALRPPERLDLSSVRLIYNGAEPISADLCRRFARTMAPHGLRPESMFTVYGLAEATLAVSFPRPGSRLATIELERGQLGVGERVRAAAPGARGAEFVKVGSAVPDVEIRITDSSRAPVGELVVGHVEVRGANVTAGYYRDPVETAARRSADGWFDTGDLGLVADGQLVITGRAKDLVIVNGQNHYPHDLERIAESVPGIETNRIAAAGVRGPDAESEELALFVLHRGDLSSFAARALALREAVARQAGVEVAHVVPVARIPKTSSGKLQRYALAAAFEAGEFDVVRSELTSLLQPRNTEVPASTLAALLAICRRTIPERAIGPDTNLLDIELGSLALARLHEAIERQFPGRVEVSDLLDHPTLAALAARVDEVSC
ncbi:non-ribosomal peptide synthetase [Piscinibacter koreensis]|uniref:Non-ribosomal peptide synthetase n=1 Tax=Piscinibacter koreensis TaxID=2742824 RepID=A0A7Y6TVP2_9BURK|nr:non-ribosomal peptide synthetase [Schlegelella koreensis]NUZ05223.1 non-ribosomal peptide synthetase [Schlegelella koreensis]